MNRFAGVGLKNVVVIGMLTILMIVVLKVVVIKHPVKGITEVMAVV